MTQDELCRAVAERVFEMPVDRIRPSWYRDREVWLFYAKGDTEKRFILYSWDANSCNACMYEDQARAAAPPLDPGPSARPLPGYAYDLSEAWGVLRQLRDRGLLDACAGAALAELYTMDEEQAATLICEVALQLVHGGLPPEPLS